MNPFTRSFWSRKSTENATLALFAAIYGWGRTVNGVTVTLENALKTAVFLACCRVISEGCAQIPCDLVQNDEESGNRTVLRKDPRHRLINVRPNKYQTAFGFREMLVMHAAAVGNGYAYKIGTRTNIKSLIPLEPTRVTCYRNFEGEVRYDIVLPDNTSLTGLTSDRILHLRGPSWNGFIGMDVITLAAAALGLSQVLEKGQTKFALNGMQSSGLYSVDGTLDDKQHTQIEGWIAKTMGVENAGKAAIMDRNAKWTPFAAKAIDAQLLESRKFQIEEVCRSMRVMPIMVGFSDKTATYASAEQMFIAHVVHTLTPWFERVEQTFDTQLLTDDDLDAGLEFELDEQSLLRGALKDTTDSLAKLVMLGILSPNEGRRRINYNPRKDGKGDEYYIPTTSPPEELFPDPNAAANTPPADGGNTPP